MTSRTTSTTATFTRPFRLSGVEGEQPPGTYTVETEEELVADLSFTAYRRVSTHIVLPGRTGGMIVSQNVSVDPVELEAAVNRDIDAALDREAPVDARSFEFRPPRNLAALGSRSGTTD